MILSATRLFGFSGCAKKEALLEFFAVVYVGTCVYTYYVYVHIYVCIDMDMYMHMYVYV